MLVFDLLSWFENSKDYRITGADIEGYSEPETVENTGKIGDGEDKIPDIDAKDDKENVFVRGEAKTGEGDLETLHTETQFKLFANRYNSQNDKESLLYIIVPSSKIDDLKTVLENLDLLNKANVIPIKSGSID